MRLLTSFIRSKARAVTLLGDRGLGASPPHLLPADLIYGVRTWVTTHEYFVESGLNRIEYIYKLHSHMKSPSSKKERKRSIEESEDTSTSHRMRVWVCILRMKQSHINLSVTKRSLERLRRRLLPTASWFHSSEQNKDYFIQDCEDQVSIQARVVENIIYLS